MDKVVAELAQTVLSLSKQVKSNLVAVAEEWEDIKRNTAGQDQTNKDAVTVSRKDLTALKRQVRMLQQNLPKVLDNDFKSAYSQLAVAEEDMNTLRTENEEAHAERQHWQARYETLLAECELEKQEKFKLHQEIQALTAELSQQSEYCAGMGSAACTLLWRVSQCEESIQSILAGSKSQEFLDMACTTLDSFLATYREDIPQGQTEEVHFVCALCGIITNITASSYGREFLISKKQDVVDTFVNVLSEAPNKYIWTRIKNLMLMTLYNISINEKGLKYLSNKTGLMGLLAWLLRDERETENQVNALRVIQSLTCDKKNIRVLNEARDMLSLEYLQECAAAKNTVLRILSAEVMADLYQ
ncbi:heat shock factor 2-binding protein-like [Lingula anatina]|uniref:Heat shock factor 2-binding protein-like n=1 Tax=Lingula anatina TaxID=7574 RepID=A0A2R2MRS7_LINAN|nr:heat shock factor 2-binding protein-like [Lingula anatina]|eukprot:XP_023932960.1 heat shock factor 2-binding protein-like [Lingula anatina]